MPETVIASWSEIDTYRQCPHKHRLSYVERWGSPSTSPALARGTAWHSLMELHYGLLQEGDYKLNEIANQVFDFLAAMGLDSDQEDLLAWMYDGHVDQWGLDPEWKIEAIEHNAVVWLPTDRGGRSRFKLKLKIDLVVRIGGKLWVVDHKTGKDLPKRKELDLLDQFKLYCWGMRQLGYPVVGSIHNAVRTQRNKDQSKHPQTLDSRFERTRLPHTDVELQRVAVEAYQTLRMAYGPGSANPPRHPNADTCGWKCDFTDPCISARKTDRPNYQSEVLFDMGFRQNFERH